jgi:hypothetical protein
VSFPYPKTYSIIPGPEILFMAQKQYRSGKKAKDLRVPSGHKAKALHHVSEKGLFVFD